VTVRACTRGEVSTTSEPMESSTERGWPALANTRKVGERHPAGPARRKDTV